MHELSVALSLLEDIEEAAERAGATCVTSVRLKIGRLSGIAGGALLFAWEMARVDTIAANARLDIDDVAVIVYCQTCQSERAPLDGAGLTCGTCGTPAHSIVHGRELEFVAMEVAA